MVQRRGDIVNTTTNANPSNSAGTEAGFQVEQVAILMDNYCYLVIDNATRHAAVIDPAEPDVVSSRIDELGVQLTHILATHHHWDHAGGNEEMKRRYPAATVVMSSVDAARVKGVEREVEHGDVIQVGRTTGRVLMVPCHTLGHAAFVFGDALFCGDTLFVGGCGRFFEGDGAQMHQALNGVFGELPDDTRVFCGHEYTVANLRFARHIEPDNQDTRAKLAWAEARQDRVLSTVPSTLGEERRYNPFLRVGLPSVQAAVAASDPVQAMDRLREKKNQFR